MINHILDAYRHCPAISFQCAADDEQVPPNGALRFIVALKQGYADAISQARF